MTENEIFEALRFKIKEIEKLEENCLIPKGMLPKLETYIIDLINCKNAEIERLKGLENHHRELINELNKGIAEAKAEAFKEFAASLKDYYIKDKRYKRPHASTMIIFLFDLIDNLVKEKTGGGKT